MACSAPNIDKYETPDGYTLSLRRWLLDQPKGEVLFLHGIISHSGWYETSSAHLASAGFNVHFMDRRGSGLNSQDRGDIPNWTVWIEDVVGYLKNLPKERAKILLGISWGGILATAVAKQHPDLITGLGLICPGLCSYKSTTAIQKVLLRLAASLGLNAKMVDIPLQNPAWFTNSPIHRTYIAQDPLTLRKITIRFARNNVQLLEFATSAPETIQTPILLMLAGSDPITDNESTRALIDRFGVTKKQVHEYPSASHTLEFEDDSSEYLRDLTAWCEKLVD